MPPSHRSRRHAPELDDFEDEDLMDASLSRQAGQEKMKQLVLDLLGRWHWITLGLVIGVLGGMYYLSKAPKIYQSMATVLIKQQTSSVLGRDQVEEMDLRTLEGMNTMANQLSRRELLEKVAARPELRAMPGLMPEPVAYLPLWIQPWLDQFKKKEEEKAGNGPSSAEILAVAISKWSNVSVRRGTRLLDITVSHPSPEVSKEIANAICLEFRAELTGARTNNRGSSLKILVDESEDARTRLQNAQNAMAIYVRALSTLKELEAREAAVAELSRRYLPKHPRLATALADLASVRRRFLTEFDAARRSSEDREYWDKHAEEWRGAGDENGRLGTARHLLLARGNVLESEIQSQTSVFNSILVRIREADINNQAVEAEVEISSFGQLPYKPVAPVAVKVLALSSIGGLGFGVMLAMIFIRLDNKIHTVSQLERESGLPALAAIAQIQSKGLSSASRRNKAGQTEEISEARKLWSPMLLFHEGASSSTYAEMFRVLRASVSLLGDEKKRRITLFSSALPGEGKTFISSNFALAAASQGKRVLLIDFDLRKPAVHKIFGIKRDTHPVGVTEILTGQAPFEDGIFKDTGAGNLHLMLAGKQAPNPGELLNAGAIEEFLATAVASYDLVVIDSAPLLAVPDTRIVVQLVDNFCLVVRGDYAPKGAVRRALAMMENDQNLPSGVIFNGFSEKRRLMGQNYSYGNYQTNKYGKAYRYGYGSYGASYGSDEK